MEKLKYDVIEKIRFLVEKKENITYSLFEKIFGNLEKKVQYKIIEELEKRNIYLVDEEEIKEESFEKMELETDPDIEFILEEVRRVTNTKTISEKNLKEIFEFLSPNEYKKVIEILKKNNYNIVEGQDICIEKREIFYDEEQIKQLKKFSNEELIRIYKSGNEEVLESLILKNYKFIYYVIKKEKLNLKSAMEEDDLFQEGLLGLKKAIDKYEEKEGNFTTYAYYWVNQQIRRAIEDKGFLIRIPVHLQEKLRKIMKLESIYSGEELINKICESCKCNQEKAWKYITILENAYSLISLDMKLKENENSSLIDFIVGETPESSEKEIELKELHDEIEKALVLVSGKHKHYKDVIIKRYGLNDDIPLTLDEVGKEMHVTRERIRQIQTKVEKRLKRYLKDYKDYSFE